MTWKGGRTVKKIMSLAQILLCTFYCNSIFPSWFLMKDWWYYIEQEEEHIHERAYQCIWNNHIIFALKHYNSTTLSMWVVYKYMGLKIQLCLQIWFFTSFDITRYDEAAIYAKNLFFSFYSFSSFLVKFSE